MDFSKIRLNNERNEHVTKRLNRCGIWKFFKVLYRDNIMRLFGFSILMIVCIAPIIAVILWGGVQNSTISMSLPFLNGFGFSTGVWEGLSDYYAAQSARNNMFTGLYCVAASLLCAVMFSGGFAVIRDAFWTGKLSTVGVFKSMGKGIKASILYGIVADVILAFSVFGAYEFYVWASTAMTLWLAIVLLVLICIVIMFVAIYLLILCSVATTYKQSVYENMDDAWRLMWLNILPNIIHFLLAMVPIALYFAFANSGLFTIYLVVMLMFGGMYLPLVWQTHMMKTFALFHPVEVKKKKSQHLKADYVSEPQPVEETDNTAVDGTDNTVVEEPAENNNKRRVRSKKSKKNAEQPAEQVTEELAETPAEEPVSQVSENFDDEDIYATDEITDGETAELIQNIDEADAYAEPSTDTDKKDE